MKYNEKVLKGFLKGEVAVATKTHVEWCQLMALLEKETKCVWGWNYLEGRDVRPTERNYWQEHRERTCILWQYNANNTLHSTYTYEIDDHKYMTVVALDDLVSQEELLKLDVDTRTEADLMFEELGFAKYQPLSQYGPIPPVFDEYMRTVEGYGTQTVTFYLEVGNYCVTDCNEALEDHDLYLATDNLDITPKLHVAITKKLEEIGAI